MTPGGQTMFLTVCLILIFANVTTPLARGLEPVDVDASLRGVDSLIEQAMEEWGIPGLAVGVIVNGQPVYARGFGVRDTITREPVTSQTLFPLGGCSEPFTSLVLGMLADEGRVDLDAPVINYIPTFRLHDDGLSDRITPRDLLAQRSGLAEHSLLLYNAQTSRSDLVERIRFMPVHGDFRTSFQSSVLNILGAEHLIERITKETWEEAVRQRVFDRLSMNDSNFGRSGLANRANSVRPHHVDEEVITPVDLELANVTGPMGWINSNVDDLMKWLSVYTERGSYGTDRLVQPNTLEQMYLPHMFVYWASRETHSPTTYGLLWGMNTYRGYYHARLGGFGDGFDSLMSFFPQEKLGVVLLANRGGDTIFVLSALKFAIADRLLGLEKRDWLDWVRQRTSRRRRNVSDAEKTATAPSAAEPKLLAECGGTYKSAAYGSIKLARTTDSLRLVYNNIILDLEHLERDSFQVAARSKHKLFRSVSVLFERSDTGTIAAVSVGFNRDQRPVRFVRQRNKSK